MTEAPSHPLKVTIADQTFRLRVTETERARHERIAQEAHHRFEMFQKSGSSLSPARVLAMALFQTAVELDDTRRELKAAQETEDRLRELIRKIDHATQT